MASNAFSREHFIGVDWISNVPLNPDTALGNPLHNVQCFIPLRNLGGPAERDTRKVAFVCVCICRLLTLRTISYGLSLGKKKLHTHS